MTSTIDQSQYIFVAAESSEPNSTAVIHPVTGSTLWAYKGGELHGALPSCVEPVGPDGSSLLIAIRDQRLLHHVAIGQHKGQHVKSVASGNVRAITTSPSGSLVFAVIEKGLFAWKTFSKELVAIDKTFFSTPSSLAVSGDGVHLAVGLDNGAVCVYHIAVLLSQGGAEDTDDYGGLNYTYSPHKNSVSQVKFTPAADVRILSCSIDRNLVIHSVSKRRDIIRVCFEFPLLSCAINAAESIAYVGGASGQLRGVSLVLHDPDSTILALHGVSNKVTVFPDRHSKGVTAIDVNVDASRLVTGDLEGLYVIWDSATASSIKTANLRGPIVTARFINPWPSIFDESFVPPTIGTMPFNNQVISSSFEIVVQQNEPTNELQLAIDAELDLFIERERASAVSAEKTTAAPTENGNGTQEEDKSEYVKELEEKIKELEKKNAEQQKTNEELYALCEGVILEADA